MYDPENIQSWFKKNKIVSFSSLAAGLVVEFLFFECTRSERDIGPRVQVGANFMIVYPTAKFPTREVVFADSDYLREALLEQNTNSQKGRACFSYDQMQGREAKIISHNRFGPKMSDDNSTPDMMQTPISRSQ